jgi:hypothetical protein
MSENREERKYRLDGKRLSLAAGQGLTDVTVDFAAFLSFSYQLAEDLDDLTARWAHLAAPRASRCSMKSELDSLHLS